MTRGDDAINNPSKRAARWIPAAGYAALIFYLSSRPAPLPKDLAFHALDKGLHFIGYALLGWLLYHALRHETAPGRALYASFLLASLYGISDEYHQSFVPSRQADAADVLADAAGALAGSIAANVCLRRAPGE